MNCNTHVKCLRFATINSDDRDNVALTVLSVNRRHRCESAVHFHLNSFVHSSNFILIQTTTVGGTVRKKT